MTAAGPPPDGFDARGDAALAQLPLPAADPPSRQPVRAGPGALVAAPRRSRGARRLRRRVARPPRLHRLHPDPDRPRPLRAHRPRGGLGEEPGRRPRLPGHAPTPSCAAWSGSWSGRCSRSPRAGAASRASPRCSTGAPRAEAGETAPAARLVPGVRRLRRRPLLESTACASSSPTTTASPPPACRRPGGRCASSTTSSVDVIAPDTQPQRHRPQHHHPLAAERRGGRLRRRPQRLRHRRHPGRLRPLRRAGPARRPPRPDRLRDQPRRQPRRRHHLLGHRRGGAGGDHPRDPRGGALPAVLRRRHGLRQRPVRLRRRRRLRRPAGRAAARPRRCRRRP